MAGIPPSSPYYSHSPTPSPSYMTYQQPMHHSPSPYATTQYLVMPPQAQVPVVLSPITHSKTSVYAVCPHCQHAVNTIVKYETGLATWISSAVGLFFFFYVCGCLFPFCCNCTKDVIHSCPICKTVLSKNQRL